MEALVSIALVGNILQLLRLGQSILSKSHAIKRSRDGTIQKHRDLKTIIADLDTSISTLDHTESQDLRGLIKQCQDAGNDLKRMLEKVASASSKDDRFISFRTALLAQWREKDIEEQYKRFEALRQEVSIHIQLLMK